MKKKKTWTTPTSEILSRGYVEGGAHPKVHEGTGHASFATPYNHANFGPGVRFINAVNSASTPDFTHANVS